MNTGQTTGQPRQYGDSPQAPDLTELPRWYLGLIIAPVRTIQEFVRRQAKWVWLVTLLIVAIVNLIVVIALGVRSLWLGSVDGVDAGTISVLILGEMISITLLVTLLLVLALLAHGFSRMLGGNGSFLGMLSGLMLLSILTLLSLATSPVLTLARLSDVWSPSGLIEETLTVTAVNWIMYLWPFTLAFILVRENYQLTTGRAVVSWLGHPPSSLSLLPCRFCCSCFCYMAWVRLWDMDRPRCSARSLRATARLPSPTTRTSSGCGRFCGGISGW